MLFITLMAGNPGGAQQPNALGMFLPIILIFVIMYFLIFRPQMKRQKQQKLMLDAIKKGDKIVTAGGILGEVQGIKEKENTLIVKIAENTKIELLRSSVAKVIGSEE
jgi:preprotein translocase subunit YajC